MLPWVFAASLFIFSCCSFLNAQSQANRQELMTQARHMAEQGREFIMNAAAEGKGGVYVFYNNPRPFCYTYIIPGEWVPLPEESAWRSKDGRQFVGVFFARSQDLKGFKGGTLVEQAGDSINRGYQKSLGQQLTGVKLAPFESALQGTWKWTAAPLKQGDHQVIVATKFIVDFSPNGIAVITIELTADDDGLARGIIGTMRTTNAPQCYFPVLDSMLRAMTETSGPPDAPVLAPADASGPLRLYTHPTYRWSVSYPADWKIDGSDPSDVRVSSPADDGVCGLHSGAVRFKTVEEFTDFMQEYNRQFLKERGTTTRSSPKQRISLPNGAIGIDILTEILSGGRSRRIYVIANGVGYTIDCETYSSNWEKLAAFFAQIISSFTLEKETHN